MDWDVVVFNRKSCDFGGTTCSPSKTARNWKKSDHFSQKLLMVRSVQSIRPLIFTCHMVTSGGLSVTAYNLVPGAM